MAMVGDIQAMVGDIQVTDGATQVMVGDRDIIHRIMVVVVTTQVIILQFMLILTIINMGKEGQRAQMLTEVAGVHLPMCRKTYLEEPKVAQLMLQANQVQEEGLLHIQAIVKHRIEMA